MSFFSNLLTFGVAALAMVRATSPRRGHTVPRHTAVEPPCPRCDACPLSSLGVGEACCLVQVGGGRRLRRRLAELGLTPGVEMTVLQNTGGPVLVCVRNSRLALGREMALKLNVLPLEDQDI